MSHDQDFKLDDPREALACFGSDQGTCKLLQACSEYSYLATSRRIFCTIPSEA